MWETHKIHEMDRDTYSFLSGEFKTRFSIKSGTLVKIDEMANFLGVWDTNGESWTNLISEEIFKIFAHKYYHDYTFINQPSLEFQPVFVKFCEVYIP